ncbi:penicillin-binding protein 2 [Pontibacillus yanchengensis]|uniref:serine-type D-Ala-D-Ala carboxypeptidase n=2 Tax=Pontibacillus yanchengensis TaxID=462910 RepID=A0A6I5A3J1_9BACI|nr:penicillin-binding protein 2 [Pontibacillus yanchengensis]MYL33459.1 penicillin-binding protein 2 [Pontibacillus yanchengensis]MYL53509.1 penicillin-binding protein 2 [Pontibacillus yanchengensis]
MGNKHKKKKSHLPFRLNVLFFAIFLLFSGLVLQLGVVQILYGADAQEEIDKTTNQTTKVPVPRGKMYDQYGNIVVDNEPMYSITYTPMKSPSQQLHLSIAKKLAEMIEMDTGDITVRDKKDYWILTQESPYEDRLTKEEQTYTDEEAQAEKSTPYELLLERIDVNKDLNYSEKENEIIAIKRELDRAYSLTPHVIKNEGVTQQEYAVVAEHLNELPGINVTTDWKRKYPYGNSLRDYLGSITSEGLPKDELDYFLSRNYSRNDRVGSGGIEKEYEMVLKGQKKQIQYTTDRNGNLVNEKVVQEGERGQDLVLNVDMELQKIMDESIRKHLTIAKQKFPIENKYMKEAMAVAMDPNTGEVLAISGQTYDEEENEFYDSGVRAVNAPVLPGSAIKGGTMLAGYDYGVISYGEQIYDNPIKLMGTPSKSSYQNLGLVSDIEALKKSSNVYMYHVGMRIGGDPSYQPNEKLTFYPERFQVFRNYYSQFGLGVKTGLDIPSETEGSGQQSDNFRGGNIMDLAIGQYDTYTTMQLAQYVSTIANDGYRVQPQIVSEIREPTTEREQLGPVVQSNNTNVLNRVTMDEKYINRVQQGFREVFTNGGTAYTYFKDADYDAAGKTGTAQASYWEPIRDGEGNVMEYKERKLENLTLVGYAPYNDPEIAFAVVVPYTGIVNGQYQTNKMIGRDLLDGYFKLKEERKEKESVKDISEEKKQVNEQ